MWNCVDMYIDGAIATIRLNRPDKHNSVNAQLLLELIAYGKQLKSNKDIRAVIIIGNGPSFCSGIDLKDIRAGGVMRKIMTFLPLWKLFKSRYQKASLVWRSLNVPVIAAIHGNCFGTGLQIALGADIRFAEPNAQFSITESQRGLVPDMGGTVLLRELLDKDVAMELALSGRVIDAQQARQLGLVTHISDDPLVDSRALAYEFSQRSPEALAAAKKLLTGAWNASESSALALERLWQGRVIGKQNHTMSARRRLLRSQENYPERTW